MGFHVRLLQIWHRNKYVLLCFIIGSSPKCIIAAHVKGGHVLLKLVSKGVHYPYQSYNSCYTVEGVNEATVRKHQ